MQARNEGEKKEKEIDKKKREKIRNSLNVEDDRGEGTSSIQEALDPSMRGDAQTKGTTSGAFSAQHVSRGAER